MRVTAPATWLAVWGGALIGLADMCPTSAWGQKSGAAVTFPPQLPDGKPFVTDRADEFLKPPETLNKGVAIAKTPPSVDFLYYPSQTYAGNPWSNWGDSLAAGGKYYASIGDHHAVDRRDQQSGNAFVYEYDPEKKIFRQLVDLKKLLNMPAGHYTPGKIHSRLDLGDNGWLYFATHRGSTRATTDEYHYQGDWVIRCEPSTGRAEVVVRGPVPKHAIPTSVLDPKRLIFYGGTISGTSKDIDFFAYDVKQGTILYSSPNGPYRYMILARSTGRLYFVPDTDEGPLMRFDPEQGGPPQPTGGVIGLRAATDETADGHVYTVSSGQRNGDATLWSFNTKTEAIEKIGNATVGGQAYIASLDVDPTGRYLYYIPGAHGGSEHDGSAVVQFDIKTKKKKVIAFLHPFYQDRYGATLKGTYSSAVDPKGDKLYITWNVNRGSKAWDTCALTVIHIPDSERPK